MPTGNKSLVLKMKKYFIANPFSYINHGITNYAESAVNVLKNSGVDAYLYSNHSNRFNREIFSNELMSECAGNIVEIPDTHGIFPKGSTEIDVHVRLHAPILRLESLNQRALSKERFSRELATIDHAKYCSSPTLANVQAYKKYGLKDCDNLNIFPNPLFLEGFDRNKKRDIDIVFICRFERLKGIDLFAQLLCHLPRYLRVAIVGVKKEYQSYFSDLKFSCNLEVVNWATNEEKIDYLSRAKVCLVLSRYESYSMVAAEGLAAGCHVVGWNIAGFAEAFADGPVKFVRPFDVRLLAATILDSLSADLPSESSVIDFIDDNNRRYVNGVKNIISSSGRSVFFTGFSMPENYFPSASSLSAVTKEVLENFSEKNAISFAGLSMNSESSENMWGCFIDGELFSDYLIYSRHPLGTYRKSGFSKVFDIDPGKYKVVDWYRHPDRVADDLLKNSFDAVLVFNGNTKQYRRLISRVYDKVNNIPVYTELGWFPQADNVYFDIVGVNAHSSIKKFSLEELVGKIDRCDIYRSDFLFGGRVLLALQLPGDTNLMKDAYPSGLSNQALIEHVRRSVPKGVGVLVRKHPMDRNFYEISDLDNTEFSNSNDIVDDLSRVDALISINSTVVLEALKYNINIYTFGYGVFSGKDLTIDCTQLDIASQWLDFVCFDRHRRNKFIEYLGRRQLNVRDFSESGLCDRFAEALYPVFLSILIFRTESRLRVKNVRPRAYVGRGEIRKRGNIEDRVSLLESEVRKLIGRRYRGGGPLKFSMENDPFFRRFRRKFKKLIYHPNLFFRDMFEKRLSKF